jgi:hypothetical protein
MLSGARLKLTARPCAWIDRMNLDRCMRFYVIQILYIAEFMLGFWMKRYPL